MLVHACNSCENLSVGPSVCHTVILCRHGCTCHHTFTPHRRHIMHFPAYCLCQYQPSAHNSDAGSCPQLSRRHDRPVPGIKRNYRRVLPQRTALWRTLCGLQL